MVRSGDTEKREIWGTREELLLAFAVTRHGTRHGTRRWDSVAMEIQSRTTAFHLVTPHSCRQRFRDLQRRFDANGGGDDDGGDGDGVDGDVESDTPPSVPWLEELRRLRVAELRREVDQYDLSIRSLQLKVKRIQEEISSRDTSSGDGKPEEEPKKDGCSGSLAGDRISSGDGSGPSVEHSNSSDPKQKPSELGPVLGEEAALPSNDGEAADPYSGGEEKAAELSYNGSTGSLAAGCAARPLVMGESGESIAESKGGEVGEGDKEASDVQSSVSLSRKRRMPVAADGGDEPEAEEVSKGTGAESRPLTTILVMIQTDKYGSVFERRLESQESENYGSLVRQHMDLEMVRSKMDRVASGRSYSSLEFFRDLLLLCTNAAVFYNKDSPEFVAAARLRRLVSKEMAATLRTPEETTVSATPPAPSQPMRSASKPKPEPDLAVALVDKPIPSVPLIVCRKRSSIANKSAAPAVKEEREEKPEPVRKESDDNEEEKILPKKATKERSSLSGPTRGLRTNKVRNPAAKRLGLALPLKPKSTEDVAVTEEAGKQDKKSSGGVASSSTGTGCTAKKQSATGFLNRMKRRTNGTSMEMLKSSSSTGGGSSASGKGTELRKEMRGEGRKEQSSRQGSGGVGSGKKAAETSGGSAKRSVGRPPKRGAATPSPVPAKRTREVAETAAPTRTPASTSRKRGRR